MAYTTLNKMVTVFINNIKMAKLFRVTLDGARASKTRGNDAFCVIGNVGGAERC